MSVFVCVFVRAFPLQPWKGRRNPWREDLIPCLSILVLQIRPPTPLRAANSTRSRTNVRFYILHWQRGGFITRLCLIQLPPLQFWRCKGNLNAPRLVCRRRACKCVARALWCAHGCFISTHVYTCALACLHRWETLIALRPDAAAWCSG